MLMISAVTVTTSLSQSIKHWNQIFTHVAIFNPLKRLGNNVTFNILYV